MRKAKKSKASRGDRLAFATGQMDYDNEVVEEAGEDDDDDEEEKKEWTSWKWEVSTPDDLKYVS